MACEYLFGCTKVYAVCACVRVFGGVFQLVHVFERRHAAKLCAHPFVAAIRINELKAWQMILVCSRDSSCSFCGAPTTVERLGFNKYIFKKCAARVLLSDPCELKFCTFIHFKTNHKVCATADALISAVSPAHNQFASVSFSSGMRARSLVT